MAGLMQQLTDHLSERIADYNALIVLSEKKPECIIANDADGLSKITSDENALVGKMQKQDKIRESLMSEICNVLGISQSDYTLTQLCDMIKEQEEHALLCDLVSKTREKMEKLKELNNHNKTLIESSLDYIDFSVNVIRSSHEPEKRFYDTQGGEIAQSAGFFDAFQ